MSERGCSRRRFAQALGAAVGAAMVFPRGKASEAAAAALLPDGVPSDFIQLNANENPFGPSSQAREAITRSERVAARYPAGREDELMRAMARLHGVQPENILLGCGSTEILRVCDMAFLSGEKNVVVAEPTFEAVLAYARVTRATPLKVPLTGDFRHDLDRMAAPVNQHTGLIYVCNPNNPTGTIVTRKELEHFLDRAPRSATVLVDEAYFHFVENPEYASALEWVGKIPNLVVARTFSKIYGMAGMRLGYAVSSPENIRAMSRHVLENNTNAAVLEAALASLAEPALVPEQKKRNTETRRWLCGELEHEGRRYIPSETNFIMIEIGSDVVPVIQQFRKRRILVGRKFPSMANWLRVSIGTRKEMEAFLGALREIVPGARSRAA